MKYSKSVLLWFIVATLLLALSACAQSTPATPSSSSTSSTSPTPTPTTPPSPTNVRLGIFIPGALGDSPPYDALADSAKKMALRDKRPNGSSNSPPMPLLASLT
jgi:ABC-type oligopeptide transport system substrate-binding subunit